jgi:hypothetical protein
MVQPDRRRGAAGGYRVFGWDELAHHCARDKRPGRAGRVIAGGQSGHGSWGFTRGGW